MHHGKNDHGEESVAAYERSRCLFATAAALCQPSSKQQERVLSGRRQRLREIGVDMLIAMMKQRAAIVVHRFGSFALVSEKRFRYGSNEVLQRICDR